jgi:hypothetical protein
VRIALSAVIAVCLAAGGCLAQAQTVTADDLLDPELPPAERICDREIDEVEAMLEEKIDSFGRMEQERLRTQLDEAQAYCDDGNEVMAAIRLEAVSAVIEVIGN